MLVLKGLVGVLVERRRNRERATAGAELARADSGTFETGWVGSAPGFVAGFEERARDESAGFSSLEDGAGLQQDPSLRSG